MDREYEQAIAQAKANLADLKERGADAIGGTWDELQQELLENGYLTQEEIAASSLRVSLIGELIKARREKGHQPPPSQPSGSVKPCCSNSSMS